MYGPKVKLRFFFVLLILVTLILSVFLILRSLEENVVYFWRFIFYYLFGKKVLDIVPPPRDVVPHRHMFRFLHLFAFRIKCRGMGAVGEQRLTSTGLHESACANGQGKHLSEPRKWWARGRCKQATSTEKNS